MYISGDGITTFRASIKPNFRPKTTLALSWFQSGDGNYYATDRGSSSDIYESKFMLYAKEDDLNQFINAVEDNRLYDTYHFNMSGFSDTEHLFGADIDYTGNIDVTVLKIEPIKQGSWKAYGAAVTVRALSPQFDGSASLPPFRCLNVGYSGDANWTVNKYDSYDGTFQYLDHRSDNGLFKGTFVFSDSDMKSLRRYLAIQRGSTVSISDIHGVAYPFGPRRGNTYPLSVKIIEWDDLGMRGVRQWAFKMTLAEVI